MKRDMVTNGLTAEAIAAVAVSAMHQWQHADQNHRDTEREISAERISQLETEASYYTSTTPEAALYQLGVARSHADTLVANYVDDLEGVNLYRNLERLLIQITRYIEATSGVTREHAGLLYYSDPRNDGHVFVEASR
ncbi:hypothetical protein [Aliirhizobium cellulosilyticum]|uniref:Uncharacterized protein n=1 Tax=Aliirhizobium cellulosilyticum TaxID=393664 RepID=A0A7W6WNP0_9HYPH|nr:hypothetical protein [Rhizobium cellulosilyticum]MBB4348034.1 hypothetical protein [Rhizobium cellulosilyticum]MBB4409572.1 hypothetical protein [Rhizobium cellulosilyticum]MBB4444261.1 hypothetical protein [Rhizobium cellulosilyticum]